MADNKLDDLIKYLEHVFHLFESGDIDPTDTHAIDNVMGEIKGHEFQLARSPEGSKVFESLLSFYPPKSLLDLLTILGESTVDLSLHTFGSRVLEKVFSLLDSKILMVPSSPESLSHASDLSKVLNNLKNEMKGSANQDGGGEKETQDGWGWIVLMSDGKASHVIRLLFKTLVDITSDNELEGTTIILNNSNGDNTNNNNQINSSILKKKKKKNIVNCKNVISIQKNLWEIFLSIMEDLLNPKRTVKRKKELENSSLHPYLSPALQIALKCLNSIKKYNFIQIVHKNQMEDIQSRSSNILDKLLEVTLGKSINHSLMKHRVASHYLEVGIPLLSDDEIYNLYANQFRGNLFTLSKHTTANHVVQKMITSVRNGPQASLIISELLDNIKELLKNRKNIVSALMHISVLYDVNHKEIYSNFLKGVLGDNFTKPKNLVPEMFKNFVSKSDKKLFNFCSLLINLLNFPSKYSQVVASSFLELEQENIIDLTCDSTGSRIIEHLFGDTKFPISFKNKLLGKIKGSWIIIAKSKCGSRCLDSVFQMINVNQKEMITKELSESYDELKYDFYGRFALQNCKVEQYKLQRDHWENSLQNRDKKRKMFNDILSDKSDEPPRKKKKLSQSKDIESSKEESKVSSSSPFVSSNHKNIFSSLTGKPLNDSKTNEEESSNISSKLDTSEIDELFNLSSKNKPKTKKKNQKNKKNK